MNSTRSTEKVLNQGTLLATQSHTAKDKLIISKVFVEPNDDGGSEETKTTILVAGSVSGTRVDVDDN